MHKDDTVEELGQTVITNYAAQCPQIYYFFQEYFNGAWSALSTNIAKFDSQTHKLTIMQSQVSPDMHATKLKFRVAIAANEDLSEAATPTIAEIEVTFVSPCPYRTMKMKSAYPAVKSQELEK